jgi:hypothetical protein
VGLCSLSRDLEAANEVVAEACSPRRACPFSIDVIEPSRHQLLSSYQYCARPCIPMRQDTEERELVFKATRDLATTQLPNVASVPRKRLAVERLHAAEIER